MQTSMKLSRMVSNRSCGSVRAASRLSLYLLGLSTRLCDVGKEVRACGCADVSRKRKWYPEAPGLQREKMEQRRCKKVSAQVCPITVLQEPEASPAKRVSALGGWETCCERLLTLIDLG